MIEMRTDEASGKARGFPYHLNHKIQFFVETALPFEPKKPGLFRCHSIGELVRGVPVADGDIPLIPERMVGQPVFCEIHPHFHIGPVDNGMDLDTTALRCEDGKLLVSAALADA